jgi:hypothetical protein
MLILGWCTLLYGVTEMINSLKFHADKRKFKKMQEIPIAEEIIEEEKTEMVTPNEATTPTENLPAVEE